MAINTPQLKSLIIEPTLKALDLYSESAVNLLLGTCAQESRMGYYLHQVQGPALGIYQIEPNTHDDVWNNYLKYHLNLRCKVETIAFRNLNHLVSNLCYATAIARVIYLRAPEPLPQPDDLLGLAGYYKTHYNTPTGKATVSGFIHRYKEFVENDENTQ